MDDIDHEIFLDGWDLGIVLTSAFRICGIDKINVEALDMFLMDETSGKAFQKRTGITYEEVDLNGMINLLINLNFIERMRFSKQYKIILEEDIALDFLKIHGTKNLAYFQLLGLKYKQMLSRMGKIKNISYDQKYTVLNEEKITEEEINRLVLSSKKNKK